MKVGLIADIHANLPALEAVLDDMPPVDDMICAGDIVGYNPWPRECLERVQNVCSIIVQGNHDRSVGTPIRYSHNEMARAGLEFAQTELTQDQQQWLEELPQRTEFGNGEYRLVHSHPDPERLGTYVRPNMFSKLRPYLDDHEGLVLGHTHIQHQATIDDRLIVNPGGVGQPRDGDSRAAYGVLDTDAATVELKRVDYDINRVMNRVEDVGLPTQTWTRLRDGA